VPREKVAQEAVLLLSFSKTCPKETTNHPICRWKFAQSGTDVKILKIFSPKYFAKKMAFSTQNKAELCQKIDHNIVFWEKCHFLPKIVIITSVPGHTAPSHMNVRLASGERKKNVSIHSSILCHFERNDSTKFTSDRGL
jgi:hypothetical protein